MEGTDDTVFVERVEPISFVAAGDRLPVHLNSSYCTASPGDAKEKERVETVPLDNKGSMPWERKVWTESRFRE